MKEKEDKNKSAMAISGLVCGIISIITIAFYYLSLPTGIIAIVFGTKSTRRTGSKLGKTSLILGIIGLCLCIFLYMIFISYVVIENM